MSGTSFQSVCSQWAVHGEKKRLVNFYNLAAVNEMSFMIDKSHSGGLHEASGARYTSHAGISPLQSELVLESLF